MIKKCLICNKILDSQYEYHTACSKKFFGVHPPPELSLTLSNVQEYAVQSVLARITVTGVQKKLSLGLEGSQRDTRLTVVGLWGQYILKPPSDEYRSLPENEDTVMHAAEVVNIPVVPHAMIRLSSGELSYITRRIDRNNRENKIAMEDFCQVTGRLTEDKYKGSVERVGKLLHQFSVYPGLDSVDLFERVIFNYLIGNSDMHLKNYSLIETQQGMRLAPAYDFLSTVLVLPDDTEESALTIHGKKSNLKKDDFKALAESLGIPESVSRKIFKKFVNSTTKVAQTIEQGFLPDDMKHALVNLFKTRLALFV